MPTPNRYEQQFLAALKDIFHRRKSGGRLRVHQPDENQSQLLRTGVFSQLMKDIDAPAGRFENPSAKNCSINSTTSSSVISARVAPFTSVTPLYTIMFNEKVYTDDRDVCCSGNAHAVLR